MADLSDVEAALVGAAWVALYPAGPSAASVTGAAIRIYRGWPATGVLDADLAGGVVNVSVFPVPDDTRVTTRWGLQVATNSGLPALTASVASMVVTFGGSAGLGQLAGILVDGKTYVHRTQAGDTPALVAAALGEGILMDRPCVVSGAKVTVPGAFRVVARVVADGSAFSEWMRQEQGFRLTVWAPDPASRDLVCGSLGSGLAQVAFLQLADGTAGRLRYRRTASQDDGQDARLYRRDLVYGVEYPTTVTSAQPSMLFGDVVLDGATAFG